MAILLLAIILFSALSGVGVGIWLLFWASKKFGIVISGSEYVNEMLKKQMQTTIKKGETEMTTETQNKTGIIELPTPFAFVEIRIKPEDLWARDDIVEWIYEKCGLGTQKDKQRFYEKCKKIKELLRKRSAEIGL